MHNPTVFLLGLAMLPVTLGVLVFRGLSTAVYKQCRQSIDATSAPADLTSTSNEYGEQEIRPFSKLGYK